MQYPVKSDGNFSVAWLTIKHRFTQTFSTLFSPVTLFIWLSSCAASVLAGPFGTYDTMPWLTRAQYWVPSITCAIICGYAARAIMLCLLGQRYPVFFDLGAAGLVAAISAPLIRRMRGFLDPRLGLDDLDLSIITLNTFMIALVVFIFRRVIGAEQPAYGGSQKITEEPVRPRLHRRLETHSETEIFRLSASNHVVEVSTSDGVRTLRMRFVDAIAEMEPVEGFCTHRSHWVARTAISGVECDNGSSKLVLRLRNGDRVPVGPKYRPQLEAAGLIEPRGSGEPDRQGN